MSIKVNGTEIGSSIKLNNTDLSEIIFNGVSVWKSEPPYYQDLKNGTQLTEAQWLAFLNGGGIKYIIDKGETSTFLRKKVSLTNSADSTYTTWSIGDFNHDSTSYTCDLILDNNMHVRTFGYGQTYSSCDARTWLTGTYYNGFSTDIRNKLQTMAVASNDSTLNDKVKLLSFTEVNGSTGTTYTSYITEGTQYPIFTDNASRIRTGVSASWWLRSRFTTHTDNVWIVSSDGSISIARYYSSVGLVPAIRFA